MAFLRCCVTTWRTASARGSLSPIMICSGSQFSSRSQREQKRGCVRGVRLYQGIHDAKGGPAETPVAIVRQGVAAPPSLTDQGHEGGKELERDERRPSPEELALIDEALGREDVLQLPGEEHSWIMVGMLGPAGMPAARDGYPEARGGEAKGAEGEGVADLTNETRGTPLGPPSEGRKPMKRPIPEGLQDRPCEGESTRVGGPAVSGCGGHP